MPCVQRSPFIYSTRSRSRSLSLSLSLSLSCASAFGHIHMQIYSSRISMCPLASARRAAYRLYQTLSPSPLTSIYLYDVAAAAGGEAHKLNDVNAASTLRRAALQTWRERARSARDQPPPLSANKPDLSRSLLLSRIHTSGSTLLLLVPVPRLRLADWL